MAEKRTLGALEVAVAGLGCNNFGTRRDAARTRQVVEAFAEARGHTRLELILSWLAAHAQVASVIAGATSPAQVRANMAATSAWDLTEEEFATADRLTGGA